VSTSEGGIVPPPSTIAAPVPAPSAWWVRLLASIPLSVLYGLSGAIGWLTYRVFPYREALVKQHLTLAFPEKSSEEIRHIMRDYYAGFADMLVEIIKSAKMPAEEIRRRVRINNLPELRSLLGQGQSLLLVAAHQCNWEWMLLAMSVELEYPVDAAYKPLVDKWAEREMKKVRSRFGSRLIPAKELLPDMIQRRAITRVVAMVADQEPTTSEHKHWTRFLNRDTAFYMGPEQISRATKLPVFFIRMRRVSRGNYEMSFEQLSTPGEKLAPGELTERYARRVEQQIQEGPADWPWSHKRWKLKKSVYGAKK
jgi:Kdo2-lipid IVA lauroyltransferase/acyltransferase